MGRAHRSVALFGEVSFTDNSKIVCNNLGPRRGSSHGQELTQRTRSFCTPLWVVALATVGEVSIN